MISWAGDDQKFLVVGFYNRHHSSWKKAHPAK
jgi:hypothetical protein